MGKEEIKADFSHTLTIRTDLLKSIAVNYTYADYLFNSSSSLNMHWLHIRHNFFRLLILDLAKLYTNNKNTHKINFFKLLQQLEKGDYEILKMPKDRIRHYQEQLESHLLTLEGIKKVRDQYIAHTESLFGIGPSKTFFPKGQELINLGFDLLNECSEIILQKKIYNTLGNVNLTDFKTC